MTFPGKETFSLSLASISCVLTFAGVKCAGFASCPWGAGMFLSCPAVSLVSGNGDIGADPSTFFIPVSHTWRVFAAHEEKRTVVITGIVSVETWLLQTVVFLTDVIFICFSSGFKLECEEFLVCLWRGAGKLANRVTGEWRQISGLLGGCCGLQQTWGAAVAVCYWSSWIDESSSGSVSSHLFLNLFERDNSVTFSNKHFSSKKCCPDDSKS